MFFFAHGAGMRRHCVQVRQVIFALLCPVHEPEACYVEESIML